VLLAAAPTQAQAPEADGTPRFVVYYNSDASPASALIGLPYTHVILSFLTARLGDDGSVEIVVGDGLASALPTVGLLQADSKVVSVSFGGGDMGNAAYVPLVGKETELAAAIASFVEENGLDGVDIDFEVSGSLFTTPPSHSFDGRLFLIALTQALRLALASDAIITHAPQGPFFNPGWHGGPYIEILKAVGDHVDWITVQYYNNPGYNDPLAADTESPAPWTYQGLTSADGGLNWPPEKVVVGKPIYVHDAANGYLAPQDLLDQIVRPLAEQYGQNFGGLAGWQFSTLTDDHQFWNTEMAAGLIIAPATSP